ncbi:pyridine nucleotide-disulfide oxidoreductase [Paraburkholderia caffeinilytica]|uniref:Oxidoreductase n=1 Tax=Paraburkholderia caffeinilytica TaxID=1761016 RepID=A0ABQ1N7M5_9BURK|nr:FAD-dependent oxidoreductase [Paraburkholderia caffeinilytica]AXL49194.1 pyridine nucleotide-disulfide oxidoreductase [Paraburkholderia caffeinilytica]GGC57987.1 oxidoreductase [Paraburkholderia caffeinilytica]CAB3804913.1 Hydrogen cyanide synthase subunit HcnB [Paraburkholderia caffeinilytica]
MNQHFDIVVVGAGPAGLNAAQAAAREGATVALLDDNPRVGGQIWRQGPGHPPQVPLQELLAALQTQTRVAHLPSTRVIAPLGPRGLLLESAEHGAVSISYDRLILATGARERLLPFAGWTLPGVTGAGALQALVKGGMPVRGERIVIAGSGPLLIAALATVRAAGARVVAVVEQASALEVARFGVSLFGEPAKLRQAVVMTRGFAGVRYWTGSIVRKADGAGRVERVTIRRGRQESTLDCDRVACGYGLVPNITLAQALGCAISEAGEIIVDGEQRTSVGGVLAAGECTGVGGEELARVEGELAGLSASGASASRISANRTALHAQRARWQRFARHVEAAFSLQAAARTPPDDATLLCRCEDVSFGDVRAYPDWREAKLHTRCGMGACQGRVCGAAASLYFGWQAAAPRPPFSPAQIGTLMAAGEEQPSVE